MDDVGAASKRNEQYSKRWRGMGNFLALKRLPYFRAWGPYRELTAEEWEEIFRILERSRAKLTVAVTAAWVEDDGSLVPYPEKYPAAAAGLREGMRAGLIEIANHGLTHCVLQERRFLPRPFAGNRKEHREFWEWLPAATHLEHVRRAQEILEGWFQIPVITLVPPGNVFSAATLEAGRRHGIRVVNCNLKPGHATAEGLRVVGNERVMAFHDRELVLEGTAWLEKALAARPAGTRYRFVRELADD
jgi:peptidoglycan/xylan/chitin deacetylase (PgdA/CDA1 family)